MENRIQLIKADITQMDVDAIVNAANSKLAGGGGVDGAIHRAAGPKLMEACNKLNGCPTGSAKLTAGFLLRAKYVIHAVGPIWRGGLNNEPELLRQCYTESLNIARIHNCQSIAFPNISTGVYGFPKTQAAKIAVDATREYLDLHPIPSTVIFVCFDNENYNIYQELLNLA